MKLVASEFCGVMGHPGGLARWTELGLPVVEVMGDRGTQEATTFLGMDI